MSNDGLIETARGVPIEQVIVGHGVRLRRSGAERIGPCPKCGGKDRFSINTAKGVFNCRGCGNKGDVIALVEFLDGVEFTEAVERLSGETFKRQTGNGHDKPKAKSQRIVDTYPYEDEAGNELYEVVRLIDQKGEKTFRQRRRGSNGEWIWNLDGVRLVPYRLPELVEAIATENVVFIPEGEKDVDNLYRLGLRATCNPRGAGKWTNCQIDDHFRDATVVIIADNDPQSQNKKTGQLLMHDDGRPRFVGWDHAQDVAVNLFEVATSLRIIDLKAVWSGCPDKGDVSDWIAAGLTVEILNDIVERTPEWQPGDELTLPAAAKSVRLIQSSAEFVRDFVPMDYLWDGILQRRFLYASTGKTGSGKTAIVLLIAASVALGRPLGGIGVARGRVLYFAGENADDVRMRWIAMAQQMDFDLNTIDVYFVPKRFKISEMRERIVDELKRIGDVVLVIVDTSAAFYEGKEVNSNTEQAAHGQLMRSLINLPGGPTVMVNCHPVKNAAPDNLLPLGAGAFLNEIDGNLTVQIDGPAVTVHWQGKFRGLDFEPMTFEIVSGITHERLVDSKGRKIMTVIARSLSDQAFEDMTKVAQGKADRLLLAIDGDGKGSVADIARRAGLVSKNGEPQKSTTHRLLKALLKQRLIAEEIDGFSVTDKAGKKRVESLKKQAGTQRNDPGLFDPSQ